MLELIRENPFYELTALLALAALIGVEAVEKPPKSTNNVQFLLPTDHRL